MINNQSLLAYLNDILLPQKFEDYCPNGLQIEGDYNIEHIITGVSICENLIDEAINSNAKAIIVHHGLLWNKDSHIIGGVKGRRLNKLLSHGINLYAYHLPLDNHPQLGNNAQISKALGLEIHGQTASQNLLWYGKLSQAQLISDFILDIAHILQHKPLCFSPTDTKLIQTIAWCTGGATSFFEEAIKLGVDLYLTGEAAEASMHLSIESQVAYVAAGHYATERYGISALTDFLHHELQLPATFIDIYNPV